MSIFWQLYYGEICHINVFPFLKKDAAFINFALNIWNVSLTFIYRAFQRSK